MYRDTLDVAMFFAARGFEAQPFRGFSLDALVSHEYWSFCSLRCQRYVAIAAVEIRSSRHLKSAVTTHATTAAISLCMPVAQCYV